MPLFGHHNQPATGMRQNEQVLGQWKTHHGELQLTNQRCLLLKAGGMASLGGAPHEILWGVELDAIQDAQVVTGNQGAGQVAGQAAGNTLSEYIPIGNPLGGMMGQQTAHLIINGQSIAFHDSNTANAALAQIQSAKQTRAAQGGPPH